MRCAFVPNRVGIHAKFRCERAKSSQGLENSEDTMVWRILSRGAIAALAGAAMLAAASGPSDAFTLSSPSLERAVAAAGVEPVYWHGGWGWHRWGWGYGGWHRWGWGPRWGYGYGFGPVYRCWWTAWGFRRCGWV
jgi:hypothetical protein